MQKKYPDDVSSQTQKKKNHSFGFGLMACAVLFLFNPEFTVIDLLPDVFGYILLSYALTRFADINDLMEEARKRFRLMIYVSLGKLISIFLLFSITDEYMRPYSMLLYPCIFGIIEILLLIPAYKHFFDGILYMSGRYNGSAAYLYSFPSKRKKKTKSDKVLHDRNITEQISSLTAFFVVCKSVLAMLPEFSVLTSSTYDETKRINDLYEYVGLLRLFSIVLMLVIGIVWLIKIRKYISAIGHDSNFIDSINEKYTVEIKTCKGLFIQKKIHLGLIFIKIAAVLSIDFYVNYYNILPDILPAALIVAALFILRKYINKTNFRITTVLTGVYGIISLIASVININYNREFEVFEAIFKEEAAFDAYNSMCISTAAENIVFAAVLFFLLKSIYDIIKNHCGYVSDNIDPEFDKKQNEILHLEFKGRLRRVFLFSILSAITSIVYDFSKQYQTSHSSLSLTFVEKHPIIATLLRDTLPSYTWFFDFVVNVIFAVLLINIINDIYYSIRQKYMYE